MLSFFVLGIKAQADQILSSPLLVKASQGVTSTGQPTHYSLSGYNGLALDLSVPSQKVYDYTVMFWFRSAKSLQELQKENVKRHYLFELTGSVQCYIQAGLTIECSPKGTTSTSSIRLAEIPDFQQWIHLTYIAQSKENKATLRLDYAGGKVEMTHGYATVNNPQAMLGINSGLTFGFSGDVREFFMSYGAIKTEKIPNLMNVVKVFDVSAMAYYRFQPGNGVLNDWFRNQKAALVIASKPQNTSLTQSSIDNAALYVQPSFHFESATSSFCDPLESSYNAVARFEAYNSGVVPMTNIVFDQTNFTYTLSMWVKNKGAQKFTQDPRQGVKTASFFSIEGCFTLFFDSPTSFKVFIDSVVDYQDTTSRSVFLPLNQWVNIQLNINAKIGITIMTFNTNGERQQLVTQSVQLGKQIPKPQFSLLNNFNGYMLDIVLWHKSQINIPYQTAALPEGVNDWFDLAILYYKFDKANYDGKSFKTHTLENNVVTMNNLFNLNPASNQVALMASEGSGWNFEQVLVPKVDQIDYARPQTLGQMSASVNLFDGLSCPDPDLNQFYLNGSPASLVIPVLQPKTDTFTVEFWFRIPIGVELPSPHYLFTLSLNQTDNTISEAMTIYIEDGLLKCAPFGIKGAPETILVYDGVYPYSLDSWQHVSCIYDRDVAVTGQHLAFNTNQVQSLDMQAAIQTGLLAKTFAVSLASQSQRITSYIKSTNIQIVLGNHALLTQPQNCYYKDMRVWKTKRSAFELFDNRFKQVAMSQDLIVNFKLMNGSPTFTNDADPTEPKAAAVGASYVKGDGQNVVCAVDRYFVPNLGACTIMPFSPSIPIVYSVENSEDHGHSMILTSDYANSPLTLPKPMQPVIQNKWSSSDAQIDSQLKTHRATNVVSLDPNYMVDGQKYQFTLTAIDKDKHLWWQQITKTFAPRKCWYVVDTKTGESFNKVNYTRRPIVDPATLPQTKAINAKDFVDPDPVDLCFNFLAKQVDDCADNYYDVLSKDISVQTQPKISESVLKKAVTGFDAVAQKFNICFSQRAVNSSDFPTNTPINFMLLLTWTKSGSSEKAEISIVYEVTVNEPIAVNVTASTQIVDVDQRVFFDARQTKFKESGKQSGIMFRWNCPAIFQDYCDNWFGSPVLELTPGAFAQFGGKIITPYKFTVEAWSMQIGPNPDSGSVFSANTTVTWKTLQVPDFNLVVTSSPKKDTPYVFVSRASQISAQLLNYRGTDNQLLYNWKLSPTEAFNKTLLSWSADSSVMNIAPNCLKFDQSYKLVVELKSSQPQSLMKTQTIEFTTESAPTQGTLAVTPTSGVMLETQFKVDLSGFSSANPPLSYHLWGITSIDPPQRINLSAGLKSLDGGAGSISLTLPQILWLQVEVVDQLQEIVSVDANVTVSAPSSTNWTSVIQKIANTTDKVLMLRQAQFASFQISQSSGNSAATESIAAHLKIVELLRKTNSQISSDSATSLKEMDILAATAQQIAVNGGAMNITLIADVVSLLEEMMANSNIFEGIVKASPDFSFSFVDALGNLLSYATQNSQSLMAEVLAKEAKRRVLQTETLEEQSATSAQVDSPLLSSFRLQVSRLTELKNKFLDSMCQAVAHNDVKEIRYNTPKLELIVSTIEIGTQNALKDKQFVFSGDQTTIKIPVDEVVRNTIDLGTNVQNVCVQVNFIESYPLAGYNFPGQYQAGNVFAQTSTLDNLGNRILSSTSGVTNLALKPYTLRFPYNFEEATDFYRNQTVCMSFNADLDVFGTARWEQNKCSTVVNDNPRQGTPTLDCYCETLSNHYIGLITDKSRIIEVRVPRRSAYEERYLIVLIPLVLIGLCLPCLAMRWDKNDIDLLEEDPWQTDMPETVMTQFQEKRKLRFKEEALYKMPQLDVYRQMNAIETGNCAAMTLFFRTMHPLVSVYYHFDFFNKRLVRQTMVVWQVSLITLGLLACHLGKWENWYVFQTLGDTKMYVLGFLFGLATLPFPGWIFEVFKIHLVQPGQKQVAQEETNAENEAETSPVELSDPYMYLKIIFMVATSIIYALTLALLIVFIWFARADLTEMQNIYLSGFLYTFRMDEDQVESFIVAWYLAVPAFGWILINGLRVLLIAYLAPWEAVHKSKREVEENQDPQQPACGLCCCICRIVGCIWCILTWPFTMCCKLTKIIATCFNTRCNWCCNCAGLLYVLDYSWITIFFISKESIEIATDAIVIQKLTRHPEVNKFADNEAHHSNQYASKKGNIEDSDLEEQREEIDYSNEPKVRNKAIEPREMSSPDVFDEDNQIQKKKEKKERKKKDKKKKDKKKRSKKRKDEDEDQ